MIDVEIRCRCERVRGVARDVSRSTVTHGRCYCRDCRAFAHWLEREDVLDAHGGTEIVAMARARWTIERGQSELRCVRLGPRGLHRWYAACCRTPMGNTLPRVPFVGAPVVAMRWTDAIDALLGPADPIHPKLALGGDVGASPLRVVLAPMRLFTTWWWQGLGHPTPLFDRENRPTIEPQILTPEERQKLREHPRA